MRCASVSSRKCIEKTWSWSVIYVATLSTMLLCFFPQAYDFPLFSNQSSHKATRTCTLLPASSIMSLPKTDSMDVSDCWLDISQQWSKKCVCICKWRGEAKEQGVSFVMTKCYPHVSLFTPCPFLYTLLSDTCLWGLEGLGLALVMALELRLRIIKFSRDHWQACCSSSRAINLVLPITVLLLPPPVFLLLTPYAIHHTLSGNEGGRHSSE